MAQPGRLYLAADGPRPSKLGEAEKTLAVRSRILEMVDWPCTVKTLFRTENLGCAIAVSQAITWFFEQEESGIILEDDCVASQDFFKLCDDLLLKYSTDSAIAAISGTNISDDMKSVDSSYFFSLLGGNWGWASWRREWKKYKLDINADLTLENIEKICDNLGDRKAAIVLLKEMRAALANPKISAWDYQWLFLRLLHNKVTIIPRSNLISNIGFGDDSTHTAGAEHPLARLPVGSLKWPLLHPSSIIPNRKFDSEYLRFRAKGIPLHTKFLTSFKRRLAKYVS